MGKFQITWLEDYSDQSLLDEIKRVAALVPNQLLDIQTFNSLSRVSSSAIGRRFGSWTKATRLAGLPNTLPDYSRASILEDLRRVADSNPEAPFTNDLYITHGGRYSRSIFKRRFGGWREALVAAGIESRFAGRPTTERMRHQPGRAFTNDDILTEIRAIADKLGKTVLSGTDIQDHGQINKGLLASRFGTISNAITLAGVSPTSRRHSEDDTFENLLRVWTFYGRAPTNSEMDKPPSIIGSSTYIRRFGGWRNALKRFVERSNSDDTVPIAVPPHEAIRNSPQVPLSRVIKRVRASAPAVRAANALTPPNRRDPSIGLRFRVFQRDHFRCILCGRSPATDLGCNLHVDHIIPFSKGGKTVLENLQTLCSECNFGKGSKHL